MEASYSLVHEFVELKIIFFVHVMLTEFLQFSQGTGHALVPHSLDYTAYNLLLGFLVDTFLPVSLHAPPASLIHGLLIFHYSNF